MLNRFIHRILDHPVFYNLAQNLLAPGSRGLVLNQIRSLRAGLPPSKSSLDIGCGPQSWLWQTGAHPLGLDLTFSYCQAYHGQNEPAITGSAARMPFPSAEFDEVWSIGMFHHLPDDLAREAITEMIRVCKYGGLVVIFDAVLPEKIWRRPLAYALRRADRGRFVRSQAVFEAFLPQRTMWSVERVLYSYTDMEIVICRFVKSS